MLAPIPPPAVRPFGADCVLMAPKLAAEFIVLAALWGASFLFTREAALEFGPLASAWLRVAVASVVLAPLLVRAGQGPTLRRHARRILFVGLINAGIPFGLFAYAVLSISTGLAAILNATVPLFGAFDRLIEPAGPSKTLTVTFLIPVFALIYGAPLLGEPITPWMVGCGVVLLAGMALATGFVDPARALSRSARRPAARP